jgi:L-threonylcarbamoyladenylate synthase
MIIKKVSEVGITEAIAQAARIIEQGGIVAYPTETFYGLGVKYNNDYALKRLYEIKQRPRERAMPLIIGNKEILRCIVSSTGTIALKLMDTFWPGPVTLLFAGRADLSEFITAGTGKVAVRIPGESFALDLVRSLEFPITATSANISGMLPADNPDDVVRYFNDSLDLLVDTGRTAGGSPSTLVDVTDEELKILRSGAISSEEIFKNLKIF